MRYLPEVTVYKHRGINFVIVPPYIYIYTSVNLLHNGIWMLEVQKRNLNYENLCLVCSMYRYLKLNFRYLLPGFSMPFFLIIIRIMLFLWIFGILWVKNVALLSLTQNFQSERVFACIVHYTRVHNSRVFTDSNEQKTDFSFIVKITIKNKPQEHFYLSNELKFRYSQGLLTTFQNRKKLFKVVLVSFKVVHSPCVSYHTLSDSACRVFQVESSIHPPRK